MLVNIIRYGGQWVAVSPHDGGHVVRMTGYRELVAFLAEAGISVAPNAIARAG